MPKNNALNQWEDIIEEQASNDLNRFNDSQADTNRTLNDNIRDIEVQEQIQEDNANYINNNTTYDR